VWCWYRPLVHRDRAGVEGRDRERELLGLEARARVLQTALDELEAQTAAGVVGPEAEPDLDRPWAFRLEREEADQLAARVVDGRVHVAALGRVEQLGEVVLVCDPVVEGVRLGVVPAGDRLGVGLGQRPETEHAQAGA
jgi:hypothetical protein